MHYVICRLDFHKKPSAKYSTVNMMKQKEVLTDLSLVTKMVVKTGNNNLLNDLYVDSHKIILILI